MKMTERMPDQATNVRVESRGAVYVVTIERAVSHNALDPATIDELRRTFALLGDDPEVHVIVLTGAGDEHFSIGADVSDFAGMTSDTARSYIERGQSLVEQIENFEKPIIAAINGAAFGGGCDLAFACTFRVAVTDATFAYIDASLGVSAAFGATHRLPRLIGRARALELLLTGRKLSAAEAMEWGLVNRIVSASELIAVSVELAQRISVGAPLAIKYVLASVAQGAELPLAKALRYESAIFALCFATEDAREGARAFLEKRPPKFQGK